MPTQTEPQSPVNETANELWKLHRTLDAVYGTGFCKDNPHIVARFMQALALKQLAQDVGGLRELLAQGSGAITVGIERP
jgi:hypothetical protein